MADLDPQERRVVGEAIIERLTDLLRHDPHDIALDPIGGQFVSPNAVGNDLARAAIAALDSLRREDRLYLALALFDTRDGSTLANLIRAAREGYERAAMGEADAWAEFDRLLSARREETLPRPVTPSPGDADVRREDPSRLTPEEAEALADFVDGLGPPMGLVEAATRKLRALADEKEPTDHD